MQVLDSLMHLEFQLGFTKIFLFIWKKLQSEKTIFLTEGSFTLAMS